MIKPIVSTMLPITKRYKIKVLAISGYQEPLKSLILAKGWSNIVASYQLGELIWDQTYVKNMPIDYLVPVPLHWTRFARRGYNQAQEIAQILAQKSGKKVAHLLKRTQRTVQQSKLEQEKRQKNVKGAFALSVNNKKDFYKKHIVLVDDLMTTGATLQAASRELLKLKPASLIAVVACRVV